MKFKYLRTRLCYNASFEVVRCETKCRRRYNLTGEGWGVCDVNSFTRANVSRLPRVFVQAFLNMQTNRVFMKLWSLKMNSFSGPKKFRNFKSKHYRTEQPLKSRRPHHVFRARTFIACEQALLGVGLGRGKRRELATMSQEFKCRPQYSSRLLAVLAVRI